ncbi:MAG: porin [Minicystis sp.]
MRSLARAVSSLVCSGAALALSLTVATSALAQSEPAQQVAINSPPAPLAAGAQPQDAAATPPADARPADARPGHAAPPAGRRLFRRAGEVQEEDGDHAPAFTEYLRLHAGPLTVEPIALLQVQAIPYVGSDAFLGANDPAERGGFRFRRARFGLQGRVFHRVPFAISAEFNSDIQGRATLRDGWFGYDRYKFLQVFVGSHNVPFSRSALAGSGDSALIERPFAVRAMAPFYQLGAHIEGHLFNGGLNYYAGVYNGLQRTDQFFTGYVENSAVQGNRFDGLTYAGRLTSEPLGSLGRTIQDLHHGKFRIAAGASTFYSDGGTRGVLGLGGDVLLHFRGLHVLGEFIANRSTPKLMPTQPTTQTATVTSYGVVGEAGYVILKERLGLTARFEWIDANTAVKDESDSWVLTGGVSYHVLQDFLKAQIDFTHREELHGKSLKNDSLVIQAQLNL